MLANGAGNRRGKPQGGRGVNPVGDESRVAKDKKTPHSFKPNGLNGKPPPGPRATRAEPVRGVPAQKRPPGNSSKSTDVARKAVTNLIKKNAQQPSKPRGASAGTGAANMNAGHKNEFAKHPIQRAEKLPDDDPNQIEQRYRALANRRRAEREAALEQGFIADPMRPRSLAEAVKPIGKCKDMCPAWERVQRIREHDVWPAEKVCSIFLRITKSNKSPRLTDINQHQMNSASGERRPDERKMVKKFRRSAAGTDEQLPSDLRPPKVLKQTVDYLFNDVIGKADSLADVHYFVWDRTRAIRNDFSIQQVSGTEHLKVAVECFERIARFHILSLHQLAGEDKPYEEYTAQQEREQLDKALLSLMHYYEEGRDRIPLPNEGEFRSYCIIFQIQDPLPDLEDRVQNWSKDVKDDKRVKIALQLYAAACNTSDEQGPLRPKKPHPIAQSNWSRFWTLTKSPMVSYLLACVAEIYFPHIRRMVMNSITEAYKQSSDESHVWSLRQLQKVLGFDDQGEAHQYVSSCGFRVERRSGQLPYLAEYSSSYVSETPFIPMSSLMVERKISARSFPAVISGMSVVEASQAGMLDEANQYPPESESESEPESGSESESGNESESEPEPESNESYEPEEPMFVPQTNRRPSTTNRTAGTGNGPTNFGSLASGSAALNPFAGNFTPGESPRELPTFGNLPQGQDRRWQKDDAIKFTAPDPTSLVSSSAADNKKGDVGFQIRGASPKLFNPPNPVRGNQFNTPNPTGGSALNTPNTTGGSSFRTPNTAAGSSFNTTNPSGGSTFSTSNIAEGGTFNSPKNPEGSAFNPSKYREGSSFGPSKDTGGSSFNTSNVLGGSPINTSSNVGGSSFDKSNTTAESPFASVSQTKSPFTQSTSPTFGKSGFGTANRPGNAATADTKENVGAVSANNANAGVAGASTGSEGTGVLHTGSNNSKENAVVSDTSVNHAGLKSTDSAAVAGWGGARVLQDASSAAQQHDNANGAAAFAVAAEDANIDDARPKDAALRDDKAAVDSRTEFSGIVQAAPEGKSPAETRLPDTKPVDTRPTYTGPFGAGDTGAKPTNAGVAKSLNSGSVNKTKVDIGGVRPRPLESTTSVNAGPVNTRNVDVGAVSAKAPDVGADATSTRDPQPPSGSEGKTIKDKVIDELAQKLMLEQNGFLDQFVEYTTRPMVEAAIDRIRDGKYQEQADEFRLRSLSLRYGQMWREISRRRRRARWGQEQRRRRRERAEERAMRTQQTSISAHLEAAQKARRARAAASAANTSSTPDRHEARETLANSSNRPSSRLSSAHQQRQSQTPTEPLRDPKMTSSRGHPARHGSSPMLRGTRSSNSVLKPGRTLNDPNFGQRRDTTRSTYFKLRAMGLDPNDSNLFPRNRDFDNDGVENNANEILKPKPNPRKRSLDQSADSIDAIQNGTKTSDERPAKRNATTPPGQINGEPSPKLTPEEEDEALFAKVREATKAMTESIAYLKEEVKRSSQENSRRNSGDVARSGMQNPDVHTRTPSHMNTNTQGSNDLLDGRPSSSISRISKAPPKYRNRISKFLPRDRYADRAMKDMSQSIERQAQTMESAADPRPSNSPSINGENIASNVNNNPTSPQPSSVGQNLVSASGTPSQPAQTVQAAQPTRPTHLARPAGSTEPTQTTQTTQQPPWVQNAFGVPSSAPFGASSTAPFGAPSNAPFDATSNALFGSASDTPFSASSNGPFSTTSSAPFSAPFSASFGAPFGETIPSPLGSRNGFERDPSPGPNSAPISPPPQIKPRQTTNPAAVDPALTGPLQTNNPFALLEQDENGDENDGAGSDEVDSEDDDSEMEDAGEIEDEFDDPEAEFSTSEEGEDSDMEDTEDEDPNDPIPSPPKAINGKTGNSAEDAIEL
ncbi:MAG: hypothetical protein M1831_002014 [Alyxoria varia]|nr:MAG: hypothetical protein M1831_002014 [Alyxoria varia]